MVWVFILLMSQQASLLLCVYIPMSICCMYTIYPCGICMCTCMHRHVDVCTCVCRVPVFESLPNQQLEQELPSVFPNPNNLDSMICYGTDCSSTCDEMHYRRMTLKLEKVELHSHFQKERSFIILESVWREGLYLYFWLVKA